MSNLNRLTRFLTVAFLPHIQIFLSHNLKGNFYTVCKLRKIVRNIKKRGKIHVFGEDDLGKFLSRIQELASSFRK